MFQNNMREISNMYTTIGWIEQGWKKKVRIHNFNRHQLKRTNNTTYEQIKSTNQSPQPQNCNDCVKNAGWVSQTNVILAAIFADFSI